MYSIVNFVYMIIDEKNALISKQIQTIQVVRRGYD